MPSAVNRNLEIIIYDKNGDPAGYLNKIASIDWEYNRRGGCGQANAIISAPYDDMVTKLLPRTQVGIFIDNQLRYKGKLSKLNRIVQSGNEAIQCIFYGFINDLSTLIVNADYADDEISVIIKDILDNYVLPYSDITYDDADIEETDYAVSVISFNHTIMDAFRLLGDLAGNVEWGVDRDKKFFFKATDPNIRRVYVLGREVDSYVEERKDESVVNQVRVFGSSGLLTTLTAAFSNTVHGTKTANLFEGSISEASDAARLGSVYLKKTSNSQRAVKFSINKPDEFIELSTPLGATTVNANFVNRLQKYSTFKYGTSNKYGNLKRDQIQNIRYFITGGGMRLEMTLQDDVPNLGDLQKRFEYELKEVQRR